MAYRFTFTPEIVRSLQAIERARAEVTLTVLPPSFVEHLRMQARVRSTHYSTRIEGNRLTLAEAEQVILDGKTFAGRERDTLEVKHYFQRLNRWNNGLKPEHPFIGEITAEYRRSFIADPLTFDGDRLR